MACDGMEGDLVVCAVVHDVFIFWLLPKQLRLEVVECFEDFGVVADHPLWEPVCRNESPNYMEKCCCRHAGYYLRKNSSSIQAGYQDDPVFGCSQVINSEVEGSHVIHTGSLERILWFRYSLFWMNREMR
ncbi:hypothetical protein RB195_007236 [Necator americanus]|uniref:Uncharacterized protein n=1 Tax=Necator americanus TaxID=51031 RepID=A0ABR1BZ45_NECAM